MVYILLGNGFEEIEAVAPCDLLRRAGVEVRTVGLNGPVIRGSHGIEVRADCSLDEVDFDAMELLMLPGGLRGVQSILACPEALALTRRAWEAGRFVAAICAAPTILAKLGITDGRPAVCYPGKEPEMGSAKMVSADTVRDGKLITGRAAGAAIDFGLALIEALKSPEEAERIKKQIVY